MQLPLPEHWFRSGKRGSGHRISDILITSVLVQSSGVTGSSLAGHWVDDIILLTWDVLSFASGAGSALLALTGNQFLKDGFVWYAPKTRSIAYTPSRLCVPQTRVLCSGGLVRQKAESRRAKPARTYARTG